MRSYRGKLGTIILFLGDIVILFLITAIAIIVRDISAVGDTRLSRIHSHDPLRLVVLSGLDHDPRLRRRLYEALHLLGRSAPALESGLLLHPGDPEHRFHRKGRRISVPYGRHSDRADIPRPLSRAQDIREAASYCRRSAQTKSSDPRRERDRVAGLEGVAGGAEPGL